MNWFDQRFSRHRRYHELSQTIREHLEETIAELVDNGMSRECSAHRHSDRKMLGRTVGWPESSCNRHVNRGYGDQSPSHSSHTHHP